MMTKLVSLAKVLRSKNSGPFQITLDIIFEHKCSFDRVVQSGLLTKANIAHLYHLPLENVREIVFFNQAFGIKITYDRIGASSGSIGERDVYGSQQHAPLLDLDVP